MSAVRSARRVRQRFGPLLVALCGLAFEGRVAAEDVAVPVSLQIALLLKVASYDKNLPERAGVRVTVGVLTKAGDADSARTAAQALSALADTHDVIGLPIEVVGLVFSNAAALASTTTKARLSVLYVTPGFDDSETGDMARALDGVSVLSAGALARYAARGTVLGFDLVGGKPKLLLHLERAKRQRVDLSSSALKLMRIVE